MTHPSSFLPAGVAEALRSGAAQAEASHDLHPDQLETIFSRGWFRMLVPPSASSEPAGQAITAAPLTLPELVRLEEGIAWADGSVGWTVTLCSGAGWFAGFFPADALPGVFDHSRICIAGSGAPSGEAHMVSGGYRVSGHWDYASGALHATAFTANCIIYNKGQKVLTENGVPLIRPFLFLKEEVVIDRNWDTIGLVATGSHAFKVTDVQVPAGRCFGIDPEAAKAPDKIYRYPFLQLAEATLTANLSGMAMHFLDCCESFFRERIGLRRFPVSAADEMNAALAEAREKIDGKRNEFYDAVDHSWDTNNGLDRVSVTSRTLVATVRAAVDQLYPYGGLGAARANTEINRVWRDLHTASQHNLLVFQH